MDDPLHTADHLVLAENNAQTVLKQLGELEENRHSIGTRWIWELLQNARDASKPGGNSVVVRLTANELTFSHEGRPFRVKELAHLIRHGSTKVEAEDAVGRYGSGFISTHLLSRRVRVRGRLDTGEFFDFWLDRTGSTQDDLAGAMNRSLDECVASYSASGCAGTEYAYPLTEETYQLAESGLRELTAWAPLVLVFADQIIAIDAHEPGHQSVFKRGTPIPLGSLDLFPIQDGSPGLESRFVAVLRGGEGARVALPLEGTAALLRVALRPETPRLFILFPLLTTDRLGLPGVVHARGFKPREARDGVTLFSESEVGRSNQAMLASSVESLAGLVAAAASHGWAGGADLLAFDTSRLPDWVDPEWYKGVLRPLLERARAEKLLLTEAGERIAPESAWIPVAKSPGERGRLRSLALGLKDGAARIPLDEDADGWSRNLARWADLLDVDERDLSGVLTVASLAKQVSAKGALPELAELLVPGTSAEKWVADLLDLLVDCGETRLLSDLALVPNQSGRFCRLPAVARDLGIDEELKTIAEDFGVEVRASLLHAGLSRTKVAELLGSKSDGQVLDELARAVTKDVSNGRVPLTQLDSLAALFWWIVVRPEHAPRLEGLSVPTSDADETDCAVITVRRGGDPSARPLAPVGLWPEGSRRFSVLFPKKRVLHPVLVGDAERIEHWRALEAQQQVFLTPLFESHGQLRDAQLTAEPEGDGHSALQPLPLSDFVALEDRNSGMIDSVRSTLTRAILLLEFILEWVLVADPTAFELVEVACECGATHTAYRAGWLRPLRARSWVPRGSGESGADKPTAESLAKLVLDKPELSRELQAERGQRLLLGLGIRPADFALCVAAPTEAARLSIVQLGSDLSRAAGGHEAAAVVVSEIVGHPETIEVIKAQRERREKVARNQAIGALVEQLLREALVAAGLDVKRTWKGSDLEVECDVQEGDREVLLELTDGCRSTLVEIKSARSDAVKMTPTQARTASEHGEGFALCVVPIESATPDLEVIRASCRFVFGIGAQLTLALEAYGEIRDSTENALSQEGPISLDITEGQTRFRVAQEVWSTGLDLNSAVARFQSGQPGKLPDAVIPAV